MESVVMPTPRTMRVALAVLAGGFTAVLLSVVSVSPAYAHGYTNSPTSRAYFCNLGEVKDCGQITYEPQSVEGEKGFPAAGPKDGAICAGGHSQYAELDDARGGDWPTTKVSSGQEFEFKWHLSARHSTTSFEYFVTKDGYDPTQPLSRDNLEAEPFLTVPFSGQPPEEVSHSGKLPEKTGHHVILSVWTIADTANAFYQCSDVDFG